MSARLFQSYAKDSESTYIIKGGKDYPYLKVKGNSEATETESPATRLVSGETRYGILTQLVSEGDTKYAYYYIASDIKITDYIKSELIIWTLTNSKGMKCLHSR